MDVDDRRRLGDHPELGPTKRTIAGLVPLLDG